MLFEGIKETQNTRIEKDKETENEIEMLYSFGVVLFEHTILESDNKTISISYFEPEKIYDIIIEDKKQGKLIEYINTDQLNDTFKQYFSLIKNEETSDENNDILKCTSHSIEYSL